MTVYNTQPYYVIVIDGITYGADNLPYTNATYGISNGTWTIRDDSDLLISLGNPKSKANIAKGGNLASGYTFDFTLENDNLAYTIKNDAVFLENRKVTFKISLGAGQFEYTNWVGVIKVANIQGETKIKFNCIDDVEARNSFIGSSVRPICLNDNPKCKLIANSDISENKVVLRIIPGYPTGIGSITIRNKPLAFSFLSNRTPSMPNSIYVNAYDDITLDPDLIYYIRIISGDKAGETYKILSYRKSDAPVYDFYAILAGNTIFAQEFYVFNVDRDATDLIVPNEVNAPAVEVFSTETLYNLSNNEVNSINSVVLRANEAITLPIESPQEYDHVTTDGSQLLLKCIDASENYNNYTSRLLRNSVTFNMNNFANVLRINGTVSIYEFYSVRDIIQNAESSFIFFNRLDLNNALITSSTVNVTEFKESFRLYCKFLDDPFHELEIYNVSSNGENSALYQDSLDLKIYLNKDSELNNDLFKIDKITNFDILDGLFLDYSFEIRLDSNDINTDESSITPLYYSPQFFYGGNYDLEDITVDCYGENVTGTNSHESPPDTIQYIQEQYGGFTSGDIVQSSYNQAEADYNDFLSAVDFNLANQITEQRKTNDVIKEICYDGILGLFPDREGKYRLSNFLVNSIVFDNGAVPSYVFTDQEIIDISDIKTDDINNIVTDIEVKYLYNNVTEEYEKSLRIIGANDTFLSYYREGISVNNLGIAEQAFEALKAGFNRTNRNNKLIHESKWLKKESDALLWLRNIATHLNRSHEYLTITIPMRFSYTEIDLFTFISIRDAKITDGIERLGWVVGREINTKNNNIKLSLLLDISATDPFLVQYGVIQDVDTSVDELIDDSSASDIINDGDGI